MRLLPIFSIVCCIAFAACSSESSSPTEASSTSEKSSSSIREAVAVDYSQGRAMNKRLGRGINLGNAWDSEGAKVKLEGNRWGDCGWSNCIEDDYFKIIADAGFNSVRIPVRWHYDSDRETHTVYSERLAGVKEDISLAIKNGLAVVVNFHHYTTLNDLGNKAVQDPSQQTVFEAEKEHFYALWAQVAKEMDQFPDSLVVLEILNEPTISSAEMVDSIMNQAYRVIRKNAPKKTIMFEAYHAAKFADIESLHMPADGNIIFSGHYYEPYEFTHEGNGYNCVGDNSYKSTAKGDMKKYVALAQTLYPDVNGSHIPMNMGEFGVAGQHGNWSCQSDAGSDKYKSLWTKYAIVAAEAYDISWHYWDFTNASGFEAYDKNKKQWYPGFPEAFFPETKAE